APPLLRNSLTCGSRGPHLSQASRSHRLWASADLRFLALAVTKILDNTGNTLTLITVADCRHFINGFRFSVALSRSPRGAPPHIALRLRHFRCLQLCLYKFQPAVAFCPHVPGKHRQAQASPRGRRDWGRRCLGSARASLDSGGTRDNLRAPASLKPPVLEAAAAAARRRLGRAEEVEPEIFPVPVSVRGAAAAAAAAESAMPKGGRKGGHKGRARQYTSPEEIDAQLQAEKQKAREEEEQGEESGDGAAGDPKKEKKSLDSDESEDEEDDYQQKRKGVEGLIDIENPNRVAQTTKKVTQLDLDGPKELSRREREEIEKQKAKERYMKMHLAGKTEQAKADLARLAIIRKQREEAARKKEEERKAKDDATLSGKRVQSLSLNK
uniref:Casein kinase substrate phosphoprotein PP28 domain-containing protein n=1 Tax=Suricata suricatta TaxID=37032 RepID=A0A673UPQ6_SURSU